jgi:hypothetical protein
LVGQPWEKAKHTQKAHDPTFRKKKNIFSLKQKVCITTIAPLNTY